MSDSKSFHYSCAPFRYVAEFKDGIWHQGGLTENENIVLNESACVFQYAQTCFEGLKAYRTENGHIVCFRPELNAKRLADTCERLVMPCVPEEMFISAVDAVVRANEELIPECGSGGALYIRPFVMGTNAVLGVSPASEFQFRVFVCPVNGYFGENIRPLSLRVSDYDRAAPHGTGHVKAGINYAMSLYPLMLAHKEGFDENIYLDSAMRTFIEETGGANLFFVTKDGRVLTPASDSILPSITRRSMVTIAREYLGLTVEERRVAIDEIESFAECGVCGTAAVVAPVGSITYQGRQFTFDTSADGMGSISSLLRETLLSVQECRMKAPAGWIHIIK